MPRLSPTVPGRADLLEAERAVAILTAPYRTVYVRATDTWETFIGEEKAFTVTGDLMRQASHAERVQLYAVFWKKLLTARGGP